MKVILICGYRRTGKDTVCASLLHSDGKYRWRIYKHPSSIHKYFDKSPNSSYFRTAFADALKIEASAEYGIPITVNDADKDTKQFVHYKTNETVSARDIYIEWGAFRRTQNIDYWCKMALDENCAKGGNCVVTDWRFCNESRYANDNFDVTTVRVYRSEVPEPAIDIQSEHDLDDYCTDFLLISDGVEGEFEKAVQRFPQYKDYVMSECSN